MSKTFKAIGSSILLLLTTACSSGGSSEDDYSASPEELKELVRATNDNFPVTGGLYQSPDSMEPFVRSGTVRFDTDESIPLYFVSSNGAAAPTAISQAISELEVRLGDIFTDITPVMADLSAFKDPNSTGNIPSGEWNTEEGDGTTLGKSKGMRFLAEHGLDYGIVISVNTGYLPAGADPNNYCANASIAPYSGTPPQIHVDPETHLISSDYVGWVNMGNGICSWGKEMVKHEMAHALGMFNHVYANDIFGLWSGTAMDILATLYSNPAGTDYSDLVVNQQ